MTKKTKFISSNLLDEIKPILEASSEIKIITAFFKLSSKDFFNCIPHNNISIICGLDFFITDPEAIESYKTKTKNLKIFYNPSSVFHPKCLYIKSNLEEYLIIGSSNMTSGGMELNYETSIMLQKKPDNESEFKKFHEYFNTLYNDQNCYSVDSEVFNTYKENYYKHKDKESENKNLFNKELENKSALSSTNFETDNWIIKESILGFVTKVIDHNKAELITLNSKNGIQLYSLKGYRKINNFKDLNTDSVFRFEDENRLNSLYEKYSTEEKQEWESHRQEFYQYWKPFFYQHFSEEQKSEFFFQANRVWGSMARTEGKIDLDTFNKCIDIANTQNKSFLLKFNEMNQYTGIGQLNASAILSILEPDKCPALNTVGNRVMENLKIFADISNDNLVKYFRYTLLTHILQEKLNIQHLYEVDCFIGYVYVNYVKD